MEIKKRLELAQEAGPRYIELAQIYEAACTAEITKIEEFRESTSRTVKFATFCNPKVEVSISDLSLDPLTKYAAIFNPTTSTEVLDEIGLNKSFINPLIHDAIKSHKNASNEFQEFVAMVETDRKNVDYEEEGEKYFFEAMYEFDSYEFKNEIDFETLEALFYLYILGFLDAAQPESPFWMQLLEEEPIEEFRGFQFFACLPSIPTSLSDICHAVIGARCIAASICKDEKLLRNLIWDNVLLPNAGDRWQGTRSPRSSVAYNRFAPPELLRLIFVEESKNLEGLGAFPHPEFWRLSCNPNTPQDVLDGIIALIENKLLSDEYTQKELLVGNEYDNYPYGLATNPSIVGNLRTRVEKLMIDRDIDPSYQGSS